MRIVVSGATGFLGRPLVQALRADGHTVVGLTRSHAASGDLVAWRPDGTTGDWARHLDGTDGVINLSGESIGGRRWTRKQKARIHDSRILATRSIVTAVRSLARPPRFLLNASGVGYYGFRDDEIITEESGPGPDFLATVCREWEAEAMGAEKAGTRVAVARSGVVLYRDGGVLEQMARPFKWFVGGRLGPGRQYVSWIHREDWIALVRFLLGSEESRGAFNATAPAPVTNAELTEVLARALHRPAFMRAPAFALKLALGEMAEALLLASQRAVPARALDAGFAFKYPTLSEAVGEIFAKEERRNVKKERR